jgi:hypothetical protein
MSPTELKMQPTIHLQKKLNIKIKISRYYTVFLLLFLFCQLYFTISQNYFIFTIPDTDTETNH